ITSSIPSLSLSKHHNPHLSLVLGLDHKITCFFTILEDEDAMEKGVADKSKKRKPHDAVRYEGPPARLDQGLKKKKTGKDAEPSKKPKSSESFKGTTKSQPKSTSKSAQVEETVFEAGDTQGL
ncbi:hypothetical protein Tco_1027249, partial [Tanacetum coccineum]